MADEPTIDELILGIIIVIKILYNYAHQTKISKEYRYLSKQLFEISNKPVLYICVLFNVILNQWCHRRVIFNNNGVFFVEQQTFYKWLYFGQE